LVSSLVVAEWEKNRNTTAPMQPGTLGTTPMNDIDAKQRAAAERWAARQHSPTPGQGAQAPNTHSPTPSQGHKMERDLELRRDGPEDDLEL
jgi:hypothetical protein